MRRLSGVVLSLALAFAGAGCDSGDTTPPTTPTPAPTITETFTGNITTAGGVSFSFTTVAEGFVTATLKALNPDNGLQVGLALGTWNGVLCQVVLANDRTTSGVTISGNVSGPGSLCVRIYDIGQITQPTAFEIVVVHP
jgi:hypothetical protein